MRIFWLVIGLAAAVLTGCASGPRFLTYNGPEVTRVIVHKEARRMELWHHETLLEAFVIQLGNPVGHKERRGDRRTPEGEYIIDRRNPRSAFHLSLGISYPNEDDIARAEEAGLDPGGDIFIHGRGPRFRHVRGDWTDGCIAVRDREMERIYAMVRDGTPITILP
jgi:murein L,D-transpeptidase YafK